jgi:phosphoglycolate phosphatase
MIKGILFDKDGTLLDFNGTWLGPYLEAADYIAASVDRPDLAQVMMLQGGFIPETQQWESESLLASGSNAQIMALWSAIIGEPIAGELENKVRRIFSHAGSRYVPTNLPREAQQ